MLVLADGRELYQSPEDGALALTGFRSFIQGSKQQLLVAAFAITLEPLIVDLLMLGKRGIDVGIVADDSEAKYETNQLGELAGKPGIRLKLVHTKAHRFMHNKFCVRDGALGLGAALSQYGSWNYTLSASLEDNFFFIDPNEQVANALMSKWNNMWTNATSAH